MNNDLLKRPARGERSLLTKFSHVFLLTLVMHGALLNFRWSHAQQQQQGSRGGGGGATSAAKDEQKHYEWQDWDYYKLLDIPLKGNGNDDYEKVNSTSIKRAYRNQAKRWHPDKASVQLDTSTSVDEANARFLAIAEAYKVLSDAQQKQEYDAYLRHVQRRQRQNARQKRPNEEEASSYYYGEEPSASPAASSQYHYQQQQDENDSDEPTFGWRNFIIDPMRVFEEFFSSNDYEADDEDEDDFWGSGGGDHLFFHSHSRDSGRRQRDQQQRRRQQQQQPVQIEEEQVIYMDPQTGRQFLRVIQTEEYKDSYYRKLAQDFTEDWDPYQRTWVLLPDQQEAFVIEEGYRQRRQEAPPGTTTSSSRQRQQTSNNNNILWPGQVLTTTSHHDDEVLLESVNGRYTVVLLHSVCDLQIWDTTTAASHPLWAASDHVFFQYSGSTYHSYDECSLSLQGAMLQVMGSTTVASSYYYGSMQRDHRLVWHSDDDDDNDTINHDPVFDQNGNRRSASGSSYIGRLDTDGALTVYRMDKLSMYMSYLLESCNGQRQQRFHHKAARTRAAQAWTTVCTRAAQSLEGLLRRLVNISSQSYLLKRSTRTASNIKENDAPVRLVCVFTTSPAGCFRPARFIWKWIRQVGLLVERFMNLLDRILEENWIRQAGLLVERFMNLLDRILDGFLQ